MKMAWMAKMIKLDVLNEFMKMTAKMIKLDVLKEFMKRHRQQK